MRRFSPKRESFWEPKMVLALFVVLVYFIYFWARVTGHGVDDKEVICSNGGEAYVTVMQKVWRSEAMDHVCKK